MQRPFHLIHLVFSPHDPLSGILPMNGSRRNVYVPTPEELRERCRVIQSGWTATERNKRSVIRARRWTPPTVRIAELGFGTDLISSRKG
jgi:hypothetical protein